jgi:glycerol kinase
MHKFIIAIDQGTSSTKTIIFDEKGIAMAKGNADLETEYEENGFVEQNPVDILKSVIDSISACLNEFSTKNIPIDQIISCGISNQRETFILWDKQGKPISKAIVWACKRSTDICQKLKAEGQNEWIKQKTGLIIDPYFSATKLLWLLENDAKLKERVQKNEVYFGTVDTWLLFQFSSGKIFKTDHTNASRTLLFNINTLKWDQEILKAWGLENLNLPEVCPSSHFFGEIDLSIVNPSYIHKIAITAMLGDSHAAFLGEACLEPGSAKATLGTGCSIMMNIGKKPIFSTNGILTTVGFSTDDTIEYAFEGAIVACGSTIEWLKTEMQLFDNVEDLTKIAYNLQDNAGVYLIPSFSGLGAPHWQMNRKASIEGLTFGTTKQHIIRAALESISYQIKDVIGAMEGDLQKKLSNLAVNGGISKNEFVVYFLSALLEMPLKKQINPDISALGAAYLAGLKIGVFKSLAHIQVLNQENIKYISSTGSFQNLKKKYEHWQELIAKKL